MARAQEVAARASLGASRWRVTRVLLVESLLLGAAGITLVLVTGKALSALISANVPEWPTAGRNLALAPMLFDLRVWLGPIRTRSALPSGRWLVLTGSWAWFSHDANCWTENCLPHSTSQLRILPVAIRWSPGHQALTSLI